MAVVGKGLRWSWPGIGMALLWVTLALAATVWLGVSGAQVGRWPEGVHVIGHVVLCGGLALLLAVAVPGDPTRKAVVGLLGALLLGASIEVAQMRHGPAPNEVLYDLGMDGLGALLGIVLWGRLDPERTKEVGHVLSWALHPLWVAPVGFGAVVYAAQRSLPAALLWTGIGIACLMPAVGFWGVGLVRRWWSDPDLSRRADRPTLFAVACACALTFVAGATVGPTPLPVIAATGGLGAVLGTIVTVVGLKVSGHVAIPATLGLLLTPFSIRGPVLFLGIALALTWARPAAGRHTAREVGAAWVLAGILGATLWLAAA